MRKRTAKILTTILSFATAITATVGAIGLDNAHIVSAAQAVSTFNLITGYAKTEVNVAAKTIKGDVTGILVSPMDRGADWSADINGTFTGNSSITYALPDTIDGTLVDSKWYRNANAFSVKNADGEIVATFITMPKTWAGLGDQTAYMYNAIDGIYTCPYHSWDGTNSVNYWTDPLNYRELSPTKELGNNNIRRMDYLIGSLSPMRIAPSTGVTTVAEGKLDKGNATGTLYFDYADGVLTVKTSSYDFANAKRDDQTGNGQVIVMGSINVDLSDGYTVSMHNAPAFGEEGDEGYFDEFAYSSSVLITDINGVDVTGDTVSSAGGAATDIRYDGEKIVGGKNTVYLREGQALDVFDVYGPFVAGDKINSITTAVVRTVAYTARDFSKAAAGTYPITITDGAFSKAYDIVVQKEYGVAANTVVVGSENANVTTQKTVGEYTGIYVSRITDADKTRTAKIDGVFQGDASISYIFDGSINNKTEAHGITVYDRDGNAVCTVVNYWIQAWQGGGARAYVQNELTGVKTHVKEDGSMAEMTAFVPNVWTGMHIGPIPLTTTKSVNFDGTVYDVLTAEGTVYFEYDDVEKTLTVKMDTVQKTNYTVGATQNIAKENVKAENGADVYKMGDVYFVYQRNQTGDYVYQTESDGTFVKDEKGNKIKMGTRVIAATGEDGKTTYKLVTENAEFAVTGSATVLKQDKLDAQGNPVYKYDELPNKEYSVNNFVPVVTVGIIENVDLSNGYTVEFNQPNDFMEGDGQYTDKSKSVLITSISGLMTNGESVKAVSEGLVGAEIWGDAYVFDTVSAEKPVLYFTQNNAWKNVSVTAVKRFETDWAVYETLNNVQVEGTYDLTKVGAYDVVLKGEKDNIPYSQAVKLVVEASTKITLDEAGGVDVDDIYISANSYLRSLPTPERIGWEFTGWYNGATKVTEITQGMAAVTLKAGWLDEVVPVISLNNIECFTVVDDPAKFAISRADVIAEDMACGLLEGNAIVIKVKAPNGSWVALENFTFDKTKFGEYEVEYTAKDTSGNSATVSRILKYSPVRPTLTVNGEVPTSGFVNGAVSLPTATAKSGATDLTVTVSVTHEGAAFAVANNAFTPDKAGVYTVCYSAKDALGQIVSKEYDVTVISDTEKPVLNVEFTQFNVVVGRKLTLPTATATDNADDNVQISVVIRKGGEDIATESVVLNEVGVYLVVYTATDYAGNMSSVSFEVFVREETDRLPNSFDSGEVPPVEEPDTPVEDSSSANDNTSAPSGNNKPQGGCGSSISVGALGAMTALLGAALVLKRKRK